MKTVPGDFEPLLYFIDLFIGSVELVLFRLLPGEIETYLMKKTITMLSV
jgi:hypothetical protein